jgi:hypothetical protein
MTAKPATHHHDRAGTIRRVDEHQRRVWNRMVEALDAFTAGEMNLITLASQLRGLVGAADLHDTNLVSQFWDVFQEIDMELELRAETWAPAGSASDERLAAGVAALRSWATALLSRTDTERT